MKWAAIGLVFVVGCGGGSSSSKLPPTISIDISSPSVVVGPKPEQMFTPARVEHFLPIWQAQIDEVAKAWGAKYAAKLVLGSGGDYVLSFTTSRDPACGPACHTDDNNGQPVALVNPAWEFETGNDPMLGAEHEILEMDVDPQQDGVEIVDPVVCYTYCEGQTIVPGVPEQACDDDNRVPDWVRPDKTDFMGLGDCK